MLNLKMYQMQEKQNNRPVRFGDGTERLLEQVTRWGTGKMSYCICNMLIMCCQV